METIKERSIGDGWTDASLQYYHRDALQYLLNLEIVKYVEKPNKSVCTIEPTSHFLELMKKFQKEKKNSTPLFDHIFQDLAEEKGIRLKKNVMYDMIKLLSLDLAITSLRYYEKDTLTRLKDLDIIEFREIRNGSSYSAEKKPHIDELLKKFDKEIDSKMIAYDTLFQDIAQRKGLRLKKKQRYDMIKLMGFIDIFGIDGKILLK